MFDVTGLRVLTWRVPRGMRRSNQRVPTLGTLTWIVRRGQYEYYAVWDVWNGVRYTAWRLVAPRFSELPWTDIGVRCEMPMQKPEVSGGTLVPPDLPSETKLLAKCPLLIQFMTCRSYTDGTARAPGEWWFLPSPSGFAIALKDVDTARKVTVRAGTIDDVFKAVELFLGTENSQWEVDEYRLEKLVTKKTKKK